MEPELTAVLTEIKATVQGFSEQQSKMQRQVDQIDLDGRHRIPPTSETKTLAEQVIASAAFTAFKEAGFRGKMRFPVKDGALWISRKAITNVGLGSGTSGVLMPVRLPGPVALPMQSLRIRDLLDKQPQTQGNSFDYAVQTTRTNAASPQVEAQAKAESTFSWETRSGKIATIAHHTSVSKQALDDTSWLRTAIDSQLLYGLLLTEEQEILAGSGLGEHVNGIIPQATLYNTALDVANDTKLDKLRKAKLQSRLLGLASYEPSGYVLHPTDVAAIELIKSNEGTVANNGLYVVGDPSTGAAVKYVWGLPVVESDSITAGKFLVGPFSTGATLVERQEAAIDISFEHDLNFTKNLATILAEERIGLAVKVPTAFVYGSF